MTVCASLCYIAASREFDPAREDFPDHGSECAVARPWPNLFFAFCCTGHDYSSTACIESHAASRERAVRDGEPGGGLVAFVVFTGYTEPRLERAAERFLRQLAHQTGLPLSRKPSKTAKQRS